MNIKPHKLADLIKSPNIAGMLERDECAAVAAFVIEGLETDKASRVEWEARAAEQMKLALQVVERKTEPWDGCANIKFPLITIAALHYVSRAYPLLVDDNDLVKCKVWGLDPDGDKTRRAARVATHQTWQNIEQMDEWEEEHRKVLIIKSIVGTAYKKRWFDPVTRKQRTVALSPKDFIVNYYTRGNVNYAPRGTYLYDLWPNDVYERVKRGVFCDEYGGVDGDGEDDEGGDGEDDEGGELGEVETSQAAGEMSPLVGVRQDRTGEEMPAVDVTAPIAYAEQMCWLDLDGDGYHEPYFVTVEIGTGRLRRIVARFTDKCVTRKRGVVQTIQPECAYVKYGFITAPDGSHLDVGFGHLLQPINEAVNTALNQIFDGATMATLGGGFLGRGARLKAGAQSFKPFEWKNLDATGDDIRKNVFPMPVREPSQMLLQLLQWLVQYGERIASANDLQQGENVGQNTPAETGRVMNENGGRVFAGIFKGDWRAMRDEFRLQHELNRAYFPQDEAYAELTEGANASVLADDYLIDSKYVRPAADPNVVSDEQKRQQTMLIVQRASQAPGYNRYRAERAMLEAYKVPNIDYFLPPPQGQGQDGKPIDDYPAPPNPKMLEIQIKGQLAAVKQNEQKMKMQQFVMEMQQNAGKVQAEILELRARSIMELAQAKGVDQGHQIALIDAMIGAKKQHLDGMTAQIDSLTKLIGTMGGMNGSDSPEADGSGSGGMAGPPDNAGVFSAPAGGEAAAPAGMG